MCSERKTDIAPSKNIGDGWLRISCTYTVGYDGEGRECLVLKQLPSDYAMGMAATQVLYRQ